MRRSVTLTFTPFLSMIQLDSAILKIVRVPVFNNGIVIQLQGISNLMSIELRLDIVIPDRFVITIVALHISDVTGMMRYS